MLFLCPETCNASLLSPSNLSVLGLCHQALCPAGWFLTSVQHATRSSLLPCQEVLGSGFLHLIPHAGSSHLSAFLANPGLILATGLLLQEAFQASANSHMLSHYVI